MKTVTTCTSEWISGGTTWSRSSRAATRAKKAACCGCFPNDAKLLVEHVMMVKKHVRPNPQRNIKGGIAEQESRDFDLAMCS